MRRSLESVRNAQAKKRFPLAAAVTAKKATEDPLQDGRWTKKKLQHHQQRPASISRV